MPARGLFLLMKWRWEIFISLWPSDADTDMDQYWLR